MQKWFNAYNKALKLTQTTLLVVSVCLASTISFANPVLDQVVHGNVNVQQTPNTTTINQQSQKAILNWQSFNIGAGEHTHFQQPANGIALNRINPQQGASQIYGRLTATGQIILVNPAGFHFGPSAYVNVGGLIASTANISNEDFLNDYYRFVSDENYNGFINNQGHIIAADHGLVALVGGAVRNDGMIQANMGTAILASGSAFTISFAGNNLIHFSVDSGVTRNVKDANGNSIRDGVHNTGAVIANGGRVLIAAKDAAGVLDRVINMEGIAEAKFVDTVNGELVLRGDNERGVVRIAGRIDVSGKQTGQYGGAIKITGHNILLEQGAVIDASGSIGGGNVNIGGNYLGQGPLPTANAVVMADAKIYADAIDQGMGGRVIIWSDHFTNVSGEISARGGANGGDGGFIETSSKEVLQIGELIVDTSATNGNAGMWLLDPADLSIDTIANANVTGSSPFQPTAASSVLNVTTLTNALALGDVTVQTQNDAFTGNGDLTVATAVSWNSIYTLTLNAFNKLFINAAISAPNGGLVLNAANIAQSITSGTSASPSPTGVTANIDVKDFNLQSGHWYQVNASLPTFNVSNDFQINDGVFPSSDANFIRASSGNGTSGSPYNIVDVFGLQGVGSFSTSTGVYFQLGKSIDATNTIYWNAGAGFLPFNHTSGYFEGLVNSQGYSVDNLYINRPTSNYVGLVGRLGSPGGIYDITLNNPTIIGQDYVGALAGYVRPGSSYYGPLPVDNSNIIGGSVGGRSYVGGMFGYIGTENKSYNNLFSSASVTGTGERIGGLIGNIFDNTLTNLRSTGDVNGGDGALYVGGLIGYAWPDNLKDSYSTGDITISGSATIVGGLIGWMRGGRVTDSYSLSNITITGAAHRVGGFVGRAEGYYINNSYANSTINVGNNSTNIGGFAGILENGSPDIQITNTISAGSVNVGTGAINVGGHVGTNNYFQRINDSYTTVNVTTGTGSSKVGGFFGLNRGTIRGSFSSGTVISPSSIMIGGFGGYHDYTRDIRDSYTTSSVIATNSDVIGGFVGRDSIYGHSTNLFMNVYAAGTLSVTGSTNVGGLIGVKYSTPVTNSFWNTDTTGLSTSAGSTGAAGYRGMTSAEMRTLANYTNSANGFVTYQSWSIDAPPATSKTWMTDGTYFPRLTDLTSFLDGTSSAALNSEVALVENGMVIATTTTAADGSFTLPFNSNVTTYDGISLLVYLNDSALNASTIATKPINGSDLTGTNSVNLTNNTLSVTGDTTGGLSNSTLVSLLGDLVDPDALYTTSGNNIIVAAGNDFNVTASVLFNLNGDISTDNGNIIFNGSVNVSDNHPTLTTNNSGNINLNKTVSWANNDTLSLYASSTITLAKSVDGANGSLNLSASNLPNSIITTANTNINLSNFNLMQGHWLQVDTALPIFSVTNNFQINSGSGPSASTSFMRALSGDGSVATPYLISDVYGLQGIGSSTNTLGLAYQLNNSIDASASSTWNSGAGFIPIGYSSSAFTGRIDGQQYSVRNLYIDAADNTATGLFGYTGANALITNIGVSNATIMVNNTNASSPAGILVGANYGTVSNSFSSGTITADANNYNIGGLVGYNYSDNSIHTSYSTATVVAGSGSNNIGGLVGGNDGTIANSYSQGSVTANNSNNVGGLIGLQEGGSVDDTYAATTLTATGSTNVGGLVGGMTAGSVNDSFWDTQVSGTAVSAAGTGKTTTEMQTASTVTNAGWNTTTIWDQLDGISYPFLRSIDANRYRTLDGTSSVGLGETVQLALDGSIIGTTTTNLDGSFTFLFTAENDLSILVYLDDAAALANAAAKTTPDNGGNFTGTNSIALIDDTLSVGTNGSSYSLSTNELSGAKGSLTDSDILFNVSNGALTLTTGTDLETNANTTYGINGDITTSGGASINLAGPANIDSTSDVTLVSSGDLTLTGVSWSNAVALNLDASENIYLNGAIDAPSGSLKLTAATSPMSISTNANGSIDVANFNLIEGYWYQNAATLPNFNVSNNFQINTGDMTYDLEAGFLRILGGSGTPGDPYLLTDIYGIQGIGTDSSMLAMSYSLANDIDATSTSTWNDGMGFVPLAQDYWAEYTGTFNGANHTISGFTINRPDYDFIGLFSATDTSAVIRNVTFTDPSITGYGYVGTVVGYANAGVIDNITINNGNMVADYYVGGISGYHYDGSINNIDINTINITATDCCIGGVAGYAEATPITNVTVDDGTFDGYGEMGGVVGGAFGYGSDLTDITVNNITLDGHYENWLGGVVGWQEDDAIIYNIDATDITILRAGYEAGGIAGYFLSPTSIDDLHATNVTIHSDEYRYHGGIVGWLYGSSNFINSSATNITINNGGYEIGGVAGYIESTSTVTNLTANNITIYGIGDIGGLAGYIYEGDSATNLHATDVNIITTGSFNGGIAGWFTDVTTLNNITATDTHVTGDDYMGIITGYMDDHSSVSDIHASNSSVTTNGSGRYIGGISGTAYAIDSITNLTITDSTITGDEYYIGGVIGSADGASDITDLHNYNTDVTGEDYIGGIIGYMDTGTIDDFTNSGTVTTTSSYGIENGGIIGSVDDVIATNLYNYGDVTVILPGGGSGTMGGIFGSMYSSSLADSGNQGNINGGRIIGGGDSVAGIVGFMDDSSITRTYNTGNVDAALIVGGIAGYMTSASSITYSYNTGNLTVTYGEVGGIAAYPQTGATLDHVYNTGSLTHDGTYSQPYSFGGIAGSIISSSTSPVTITNAYNLGYINSTAGAGSGDDTGGILGSANSDWLILGNVYNIGEIVSPSIESGAIIGGDAILSRITITGNVFWNNETATIGTGFGDGVVDPASVMSKTTAEMKQQSTYVGWDFTTGAANWNIENGQTYPFMQFFYPDTSTLRVVSGFNDLPTGGDVGLAYDGAIVAYADTGADGSFYFLQGDNFLSGFTVIENGDPFMLFYSDQATVTNYIQAAPGSYADITGINLTGNQLMANQGSFSNSGFASLVGSIIDDDILFSTNGNDITLGNATNPAVSLVIGANATYDINGDIATFNTSNGSSVTFNTPATVSTDATINVGNGYIILNTITIPGANTFTLASSNAATLNGDLTALTGTLDLDVPGLTTSNFINVYHLDMTDFGTGLIHAIMTDFNDGGIYLGGTAHNFDFHVSTNFGVITGNPNFANYLIPIDADYPFLVRHSATSGLFTDPMMYFNFIVPEFNGPSFPTGTANVITGNYNNLFNRIYIDPLLRSYIGDHDTVIHPDLQTTLALPMFPEHDVKTGPICYSVATF